MNFMQIYEIKKLIENNSRYLNCMKVNFIDNSKLTILINHKNKGFMIEIAAEKNNKTNINLLWEYGSEHYASLLKFNTHIDDSSLLKEVESLILKGLNIIEKYSNLLISVVVPVYNRENLIEPLLKSLNKQTLSQEKFEVIFVDDASTDDTIKVIKNYAINFNYTIINRNVNSGNASTPRNEGIRVANGEYILFIDSDDFIAEYTLNDIADFSSQNDSDIIVLKLISPDGRPVNARTYNGRNVKNASVYKDYLLLSFYPFKAVKNSFLKRFNIYFDPNFKTSEDKIFITDIITQANRISILREKNYIYVTKHEGYHLGKEKVSERDFNVTKLWTTMLTCILLCNDNKKKRELYNCLLYRFVRDNKKLLINKSKGYALNIMLYFISHINLYDINLIYNDAHDYLTNIVEYYINLKKDLELCIERHTFDDIYSDVVMLGRYNNNNLGGAISVLATYKTLNDLGYNTRIFKLKGHNNDENMIYNKFYKFTNNFINDPEPHMVYNDYFNNFIACSDWMFHKKWFLPLDVRLLKWVKDDKNKISLASSFGTHGGNFEQKDYNRLSTLLNRFQYLSVREKDGVDFCKKIGVSKVFQLADPIFSQKKEYYLELSKVSNCSEFDKIYSLIFLQDMDIDQINSSINITNELGLKPIFIVASKDKEKVKLVSQYKFLVFSINNIPDWIDCLNKSEYIITNSFYTTCLALILGKNFITLDRCRGLSTPTIELLNQFSLNDRFLTKPYNNMSFIENNIDFKIVDIELDKKLNTIRSFIIKSIS